MIEQAIELLEQRIEKESKELAEIEKKLMDKNYEPVEFRGLSWYATELERRINKAKESLKKYQARRIS